MLAWCWYVLNIYCNSIFRSIWISDIVIWSHFSLEHQEAQTYLISPLWLQTTAATHFQHQGFLNASVTVGSNGGIALAINSSRTSGAIRCRKFRRNSALSRATTSIIRCTRGLSCRRAVGRSPSPSQQKQRCGHILHLRNHMYICISSYYVCEGTCSHASP